VREVVVSVEFADSQAIVGYITAVQRREEVFVETFESDRCRERSLGLAEILS
jgi:glycine cleavage system regulatory protein